MTEHASLIQVTTFRPAPGRRDEVLALRAQTQERAAADGRFGAQTCTVDEDPDAVVAGLPSCDYEQLVDAVPPSRNRVAGAQET